MSSKVIQDPAYHKQTMCIWERKKSEFSTPGNKKVTLPLHKKL